MYRKLSFVYLETEKLDIKPKAKTVLNFDNLIGNPRIKLRNEAKKKKFCPWNRNLDK